MKFAVINRDLNLFFPRHAVRSEHQQVNRLVVQSLNSPFFPPFIGAEPGRAKGESRITCMRMLRTPPFFSPKSGEKSYLEVLSRFGLWRDFLNRELRQRSDYLFSSCNPEINHTKIDKCMLLFTTDENIFSLL